ncbi:MAG: RNA 2',3'-cyclic phosphodiesterase [Myxococcaceae bacterium]|jgi:2'-5' RNA ligase|nr:RNA 2',3'-cyclic phosphodiesterase [Myxococcaceae bacterium]MCA3014966.1 RNA 2',3'-cyclic phosphodiesterase [Myxococcaceae bacterium]
MSVFLAIDLDDTSRALAGQVIERARPTVDARWVHADKLHLTLVFLGNPTPAHVATLTPLVDAVASRHGPLSLSLAGVGTFGTARAPSVLWLGVGGALEALSALQADARQTLLLDDLPGVQPVERTRPYAPHVTLARAKVGLPFGDLEATLRDFAAPPFTARHVTLFESVASSYRAVHRSALGDEKRA